MGKIKYPRTTLEICDATLDVIRRGMHLGIVHNYPEIDCYNGRRWSSEGVSYAIYYVRTRFHAFAQDLSKSDGVEAFDVRLVIIRTSSEPVNEGFPFFWVSAWYRRGNPKPPIRETPQHFSSVVYQEHYVCEKWSSAEHNKVRVFDPVLHFPDMDLIQAEMPPHPIKF